MGKSFPCWGKGEWGQKQLSRVLCLLPPKWDRVCIATWDHASGCREWLRGEAVSQSVLVLREAVGGLQLNSLGCQGAYSGSAQTREAESRGGAQKPASDYFLADSYGSWSCRKKKDFMTGLQRRCPKFAKVSLGTVLAWVSVTFVFKICLSVKRKSLI